MPTHYEILGVPHDASDEDLRKAYHRLAIRWHPDKNPADRESATERFKEIARAYEVLRDPRRRREYDFQSRAGAPTLGGTSRGPPDVDPDAVFAAFFQGSDPFAQMAAGSGIHVFSSGPGGRVHVSFGGGGFGRPEPTSELRVSLEDVWSGTEKRVKHHAIQVPRAAEDGAVLKSADGRASCVLRVARHPLFERVPRTLDLVHHVRVSLLDFWCGRDYQMRAIDGQPLRVSFGPRCLRPLVLQAMGLRSACGTKQGSLVLRPCLVHPRARERLVAALRALLSAALLYVSIRNPQVFMLLMMLQGTWG